MNGTTIHSATGIGVPKCQEDFRRMHQGFRKELWTKLVEVLIIDETTVRLETSDLFLAKYHFEKAMATIISPTATIKAAVQKKQKTRNQMHCSTKSSNS